MIESKQLVCLASTMRSGSTLLKALLAEAEDVSNLPEINFQRYANLAGARTKIERLDSRRIVLLKRPAWYTETRSYPRLPQVNQLKVILLVRDVYDTVESCRRMTFGFARHYVPRSVDTVLALKYWCRITTRLLDLHEDSQYDTCLIRYEDLIATPLDHTKSLFEFIGSQRSSGVESYRPPVKFRWRWGRDDGSSNIRSLTVQRPHKRPRTNLRLLRLVEQSTKIQELSARIKRLSQITTQQLTCRNID